MFCMGIAYGRCLQLPGAARLGSGLCLPAVASQAGVCVVLSPSRGCPDDCSKSSCPLLSRGVSTLRCLLHGVEASVLAGCCAGDSLGLEMAILSVV